VDLSDDVSSNLTQRASLIVDNDKMRKLDEQIKMKMQGLEKSLEVLRSSLRELDSSSPAEYAQMGLTEKYDMLESRVYDLLFDVEESQKVDTSNRAARTNEPMENPGTRLLSNAQLLQDQHAIMNEQDDQLDDLGRSLTRQAEIGLTINDELITQGEMLEDLHTSTNRTARMLKKERKRLTELAKRGGMGALLCFAVVGVIIVFFILLAVLLLPS
jgi:hypothetical protein